MGFLSLHVNDVIVYIHKVKLRTGQTLGGSTAHFADCDNIVLESDESKTIVHTIVGSPQIPEIADIVIVVDYRPFWWPRSSRKYARFTGAYINNWQWTAQPSSDIRREIDTAVDDDIKQFTAIQKFENDRQKQSH